jgi:hypothetical protein
LAAEQPAGSLSEVIFDTRYFLPRAENLTRLAAKCGRELKISRNSSVFVIFAI